MARDPAVPARSSGSANPDPIVAPPGGSVSVGPAFNVGSQRRAEVHLEPASMRIEPDVFPVSTGVEIDRRQGMDGARPRAGRWSARGGPLQRLPRTGDNPEWEKQLQTVVIDEDGVEITGFIFADNYYELYVNGQIVARDTLGMTPFNSTVVRFRARYPMTYAIKGIDWETKHGLGMEYQPFNIGDGGFIAYFSDGNGTHADWRAETFYIAPLDDPLRAHRGGRDSSFCSQAVRPTCAQKEPESCKAVHFPIPDGGRRRDSTTAGRAPSSGGRSR